jgi:predicted nucleic acid-binding protein
MILIDTNVLVALVDEKDRLHLRAKRDLGKLKGPFGVTSPVLTEACFLLEQPYLRGRLAMLLERLPAEPVEPELPWWPDVFAWLNAYADHTPDLCDAVLVTLAARSSWPVWTYDTEFSSIWRLPNGRRIALAASIRR